MTSMTSTTSMASTTFVSPKNLLRTTLSAELPSAMSVLPQNTSCTHKPKATLKGSSGRPPWLVKTPLSTPKSICRLHQGGGCAARLTRRHLS